MTMLHRAYAFAHSDFRAELAPILERALDRDDGSELARFIEENLDELTDPYEGEPLAQDWQDLLESGDVQELGDFALTKYYDGDLDMGLDADWLDVKEELSQAGADPQVLLGARLGAFDPGRQGAYFQSEADVERGLATVRGLLTRRPTLSESLSPLLGLLGQAARQGKGLYVTF